MRIASWLHDGPRWRRAAVLAALGAICGLGQAPLGLWWATLAALAVVLILVPAAPTPRRAFGACWAFGLGYFALTLRWIVEPFLVDAASTGWMAPFAIVLMASGAALFWGAAAWGAARLHSGALGLAMMLTLAEATRSLILTGFPWALIGHVWVDTPIAQAAALVGPHGLTLITLVIAWSLSVSVRFDLRAAAVQILAVAAWLLLNPGPAPDNTGPMIRLVQPNVPQDQKWDPAKRQANFDRILAMTAAGARPALIVWPETAIPVLMDFAQPQLDLASDAAGGVPLITGINRSDGQRYYNSFVLLGQGGVTTRIYDKAHLAPFGEYIPFGEWLDQFGIRGLAASQGGGFTAGGVQPLVEIPGIGPARALICYEGIFAEEVGHTDRPRLMVLITNDAWFGTAAGPYQHLAQAQLRAIEQGVPMVRVANTGVSAMIDARGRITAMVPLGQAGAPDVPLPPVRALTVYAQTGDLPILMLALLSLVAATWRQRRFS
ncbi:apolipoprotein N-acyltransferase [Yoonia sp. R2331]|uniref:apolipoprotein N-acyltransferase n=1 Tax=Yoonia sp. R2331 TaxID=3237238 RepID=UPI0034E40F33